MATYTPVTDDDNDEVVQETSLKSSSPRRSVSASALPILNMPVVVIGDDIYPAIQTNMLNGVLPVGKGGTGLSTLDGGRLLASNEDGTLLEEVDVDVQNLAGLTGNIQNQLNDIAGAAKTLLATIPSTAVWSENPDGDGYVLTLLVEGIKSVDNPVVGLISSATSSEGLKAERMAYDCIDEIITNNGSITLICFDSVPTTTFSISLHCTGA